MTRRINAIGYAMHRSRSHDAVIRVYDDAGKNGMKSKRSQKNDKLADHVDCYFIEPTSFSEIQ